MGRRGPKPLPKWALQKRASVLLSRPKQPGRIKGKVRKASHGWTMARVAELEHYVFPGGYSPEATKGDCTFDHKAAFDAVTFGWRFFRHTKGAMGGKPLNPELWQAAIYATLFGWKRPDKTRRYRTAYIEVPRGNGKSTMCVVIVGLLLYVDNEPGADIFSAAGTRMQAKEVFGPFKLNVLSNAQLHSVSQCFQNSVVRLDTDTGLPDGSYQAISADADFQHGGNPHGIIFDELHVQKNRDLWDVLQSGKLKRAHGQPLTVAITTAGFDRETICWEQHEYAETVRDGIRDDPSFLPIIYAATAEDDWTSPATWQKANPNLGVSILEMDLAAECEKAKNSPGYENTFKRLHLNIWTDQDVLAIPMPKWDACGDKDPWVWRVKALERFRNEQCIGGLDLGSTGDLTALALLFGQRRPYTVLPFFWIPAAGADKRERKDGVPYRQWAAKGYVTLTSGDTTDYDKVRADITALATQFRIAELAVDRLFQGAQLCTQLAQDGHQVVAFGQGFMSMAAPTKEVLETVIAGGLIHGGNPVLRRMASKAATVQDSSGNLKFCKKRSGDRIDGILATTMAIGRAMMQVKPHWFYETNLVEMG